jgi:hypothetical protein
MSMGVLEIPNMPESRSEVVLLRRTSVATEAAAASVETMMPTPVARLTWRLIGALRASLTREMHRRVMTRLMRLWIVVEMIEIVRMASPLGAEAARIACRTMKAAVAKMAARPTARGSNDRIASRIWCFRGVGMREMRHHVAHQDQGALNESVDPVERRIQRLSTIDPA